MAIDSYMVFEIDGSRWLTAESQVTWKDNSILGAQKDFISIPERAKAGQLFEVDDYSFSVEQQLNIGSQSSGTGAGRVKFGEFTVNRKIDLSSPDFYTMACTGQPFSRVSLLLRKGAGDGSSGLTFVRFDFKLVAVSKVEWSHDDESPKEGLTFEYGSMRIGYTQQKGDGSMGNLIQKGWNRVNNERDDLGKVISPYGRAS